MASLRFNAEGTSGSPLAWLREARPRPPVVRSDQVQGKIAIRRFHRDIPVRFGKRTELVTVATEQLWTETPFGRFREEWAASGNPRSSLPDSSRLSAVMPASGGLQRIDFVSGECERRAYPANGVADKRAMLVDGLGRGAEPRQIALAGLELRIGAAKRMDQKTLLDTALTDVMQRNPKLDSSVQPSRECLLALATLDLSTITRVHVTNPVVVCRRRRTPRSPRR